MAAYLLIVDGEQSLAKGLFQKLHVLHLANILLYHMSTAPKIKHVHYDGTCPIMDRNQIDTLILGDESNTDTTLVRELFDLFVNEGATKLEALPTVCAQGDVHELRSIVHFIVGSACHLGLVRLAAFYRAIERAVDEEPLTDRTEVEAPIRREFELAREAFRADFNF